MTGRDGDELLALYQAELTHLREAGAEFGRRHPRVAQRLELGTDESPDPHVERLIESFAFLTARIQRQLNDEFPDAAAGLLDVLYPHFTAPVPSSTVACFEVAEGQVNLTGAYPVPRGTQLAARTQDDVLCRFRTCYQVQLWPVKVAGVSIESPDRIDAPRGTEAVLRIRLRGWGRAKPTSLRFYLAGELRSAATLYEYLFACAGDVMVRAGEDGPLVRLPPGSLQPVGFAREEALLEAHAHAHPGYRLLQEYFADPRKFLFADFLNLDRVPEGRDWEILVPLRRAVPQWLRVDERSMLLGCTPVVNLFKRITEPVRIDHRRSEYRLVPDVRRPATTEVHTLLRISSSSDPNADEGTYQPLYSFAHGQRARAYWHARRVPTRRPEFGGTDILLSFVDLDFNAAQPADRTVWAHTLCTNRRLASQLQPGQLLQTEETALAHEIRVLHHPTAQRDPPLAGATLWRLVSQLSLNQLSLEGPAGHEALQEILRLYGSFGQVGAEEQASGVTGVSCRRVVRRAGDGAWRGMCRGTEITLTFDEAAFSGTTPFLLATVLRHFLGLYAAVNSFTQTIACREEGGAIWKQWPPLTGEQTLL